MSSRPLYEQPLQDALRIADSGRYTPESQPEVFRFIKDIESRIESYRETAEAIGAKKPVFYRALPRLDSLLPLKKTPFSKKTLIDKEAVIGGNLFTKRPGTASQRFWYHGRYDSRYPDQGEWLFESVDTNGHENVLRILTTGAGIEKLYHGRPVPFTAGEIKTFINATERYEDAILEEYPVDAALQEFKKAA